MSSDPRLDEPASTEKAHAPAHVFVCALFVGERSLPSVIGPVFSTENAATEWASKASPAADPGVSWRVFRRALDPTKDADIFGGEATPYITRN